jgi:nicotinamidase-related amidase
MISLDPKRSALLVMDFQADILGMLGESATSLLERTARLIAAARKAQSPIFYVVVGFRPGYPEVSARNASFAGITQSGRFVVTTPGSDIAPALSPKDGDIVVVKHRVSAFSGTDLDMILRAKGINTLVLTGIATSGVVLSTVRHAADTDYQIVVVEDCCADRDEEVHRVLTQKVFARHSVTSASEVTAAFEKAVS